jgi:5-methylcytosine-specific restriction protein B
MSEYEPVSSEEWRSEDSRRSAKKFLLQGEPVVLYGPPGTGKSRMAKLLVDDIRDDRNVGIVEEIQFHQKFSYEDFVQGYRPDADGFALQPGVFKRLCKKAKQRSEEEHVLIIDEFNRTELSTTLGEVLYLIEDREKRSVQLGDQAADDEDFQIPSNLNIIATMNTADRTIAVMDFALRRRFTFIPVWPDYAVMKKWIHQIGFDVEEFTVDEYATAVQVLNGRIIEHPQMNKHMQLGHTLFVPNNENKINIGKITDMFRFAILPQLERYVGFGREDELKHFVGEELTQKLRKGRMADSQDIVSLVQSLVNDDSAGTLDVTDE